MANQTINARIQEHYHTLEWWTENDPVLLEGEPAYVIIETLQDGATVSSIMKKVGDGTSKFSELDFVYAKSADVHEWAKQENLSYDNLPTELKDKIATLESEVCTTISNNELEEILI